MDIAQHIRIFDKIPTDELVEKRTTAITSLGEKYQSISSVENILQLAADFTKGVAKGGSLPEPRIVEIEAAIRETSGSFVRQDQELQVLTCGLLAALKLLAEATPTSGEWSRRDVLALGLWSGLGFQIPRTEERLEGLRSELLVAARNLVLGSTANARKRQEVPAFTAKMPEAYDATKIGNVVQNGAARAIDALRTNAALDREEIDLLWWVLSGWSKFVEKIFSKMSEPAAVVIAGLEAGSIVRRIPGDAHKHLILRLLTEDKAVSMQDMLESLKDEREKIAVFFANNPLLAGREALFPLVSGLVAGKVAGKGTGARTLKLSDWSARALLESAILHVGQLPRNLV
ncbi:MAG: GTPase-associated system all-helical protein GASH [Terriglobales bacterium]